MLDKINTLKDYVERHKTFFLMTALVLTTTTAVLMKLGLREHDAFLKEHKLYDKYYFAED